MKFLLSLAVAVLAANSFGEAKPLASATSRGLPEFRFHERPKLHADTAIKNGQLIHNAEPSDEGNSDKNTAFLAINDPDGDEGNAGEAAFLEILPGATQTWHESLDYSLPKYTPGAACGAQADCKSCLINQVCVWLPFQNSCVEDRNPEHSTGTMQCNSWSPDELPVISNEHDDFRLFHTRSDPRDFNIASLNGGQDIFTSAVDQDFPDHQHPLIKGQGGGEIIDGLTPRQFDAQVLNHNDEGQMLPKGAEGLSSESSKECNCNEGQGAGDCECGFLEPAV